jgi:hypothetical protein
MGEWGEFGEIGTEQFRLNETDFIGSLVHYQPQVSNLITGGQSVHVAALPSGNPSRCTARSITLPYLVNTA